MKRVIYFLSFILFSIPVFAQVGPDKYFVEFTDKAGTPYSIDHPEDFLSPRSIERRSRHLIQVTDLDLPVNPAYVDSVASKGVTLLNRTKWFNGVTIFTQDPVALQAISDLPFVKQVRKGQQRQLKFPAEIDKFNIENANPIPYLDPKFMDSGSDSYYDYGLGFNQIHMLNGDFLHDLGYQGQGMVIAVLDAGFMDVDRLPVFDSLRSGNQILGTRDFVLPGNDVYREAQHGMSVLSTMGGNLPGLLVGTAPEADYWLLRTEQVPGENYIEEFNWVSGAEFADSVGADLINSSLGYTTFDDPQWDHSRSDLDGHSTLVTRGANFAAQRGIAVICSAGNSGLSPWRYISAPADGDYVMAVGSVDSIGNYSLFSGHGIPGNPIKPNVVAQGELASVASPDSTVVQGSGTSFSSPVLAGLVACLWQSKPEVNVMDLYHAIERSSSQYSDPDTLLGYGIPDFSSAYGHLGGNNLRNFHEKIKVFPNPFTSYLLIRCSGMKGENVNLILTTIEGKVIYSQQFVVKDESFTQKIDPPIPLPSGHYFLSLITNSAKHYFSVVKM